MNGVQFFKGTCAEMSAQCWYDMQSSVSPSAIGQSRSAFFQRTRAPMTLQNWETNVNNHLRKSSEGMIALHLRKNGLKHKRAQQMAKGAFDEDIVREVHTKAQKRVSAAEQLCQTKAKRRRPNDRPFPLGEENEHTLLTAENRTMSLAQDFTAPGLTPTPNVEILLDGFDQLITSTENAQPSAIDGVLANVAFVVAEETKNIRGANGGTLTTMGRENYIQQQEPRESEDSAASEVYSVAFMEHWLREADPKRNERACPQGKKCVGRKTFSPHIRDGIAVPVLREFLVFEERIRFYRTGELPNRPRVCLLCKLKGVHLAWILNATMLESQDYTDKHCAFENLFDVTGEVLSMFALANPPTQYFGLPGRVLLFEPTMVRPVPRPGSDGRLALKFVPACLTPISTGTHVQDFRIGLAASSPRAILSTLPNNTLLAG